MRDLIVKAIDGFNESGRFDSNRHMNGKKSLTVDFDQVNSTINWYSLYIYSHI